MIERAFAWAESKSKTRVNAIHGEPEAFLILSDSFAVSSEDTEENIQEGNVEVEDRDFLFSCFFFQSSTTDSCSPKVAWLNRPLSLAGLCRVPPGLHLACHE